MKVDVLLGLQWGDEGKGKIVDVLTPNYEIIARFQGGPNAGHTLEFNEIKHVLHIIPSGVFRENAINVIGNGVVIDPAIFYKEISDLKKLNVDISERLLISNKAHLIIPSHRILDAAYESSKGKAKIGSTLKGIGPTYTDKIGRHGLRIGDINSADFLEKYNKLKSKHEKLLKAYSFDYDLSEYEKKWFEGIEMIKRFKLINSEHTINNYIEEEKTILAEGAQGTLLDIDFGSYPFVTSSNTICAGACTGLGVAPNKIGEVYGIFKAYCTRVGSGPFPSELNDEEGELLRKEGNEFGATTGRPRRCGWLDLTALKYSIMINGVTQLIMTKVDVLNAFDKIKVAVGYQKGNKTIDQFPHDLNEIEPIYREFKGWKCNISEFKVDSLPKELNAYIKFLEDELKVPISIISIGANRNDTLFR
ncbi:MAG: adenylosuccinate synthase [Bacteroidetes bacterium]|jgi:adenylosuccinate synthase|nr:adenylosuccinate synthase [Bacteroidota bacterium]MBT6687746.1 adenylosuccinate synthase [Bacteroidota bacterium]MBT7143380.1 adenylosuccinate synthase [Bacteroidota bacterium]MBT7490702.1 adenylosuccinate synthase [Bacteroidota bacterium]